MFRDWESRRREATVLYPGNGRPQSVRESNRATRLRAAVPPGRDAAPRSWEQTNHGDRDTIRHWQRNLEQRGRLEEKYPELAVDNRAVLAHEGRYAASPLRAGDPAAPGSPGSPGSPPADPHGHHHPHGHVHPHTHTPAPTAPSEPPGRSQASAPT